MMRELLLELGFNEKEVRVYLALLEFGIQPASVIAKKTGYPKSTVLFLFDTLLKRGYLRKSNRGRVQYFCADPEDIKLAKESEFEKQKDALDRVLPLLNEMKTPFSSEPKTSFYEGIDGCKRAYELLLGSSGTILEFGAHLDLVEKFGEKFMNTFIGKRVKNGIFLKAVSLEDEVHKKLYRLNKKHLREIQFFPPEKGRIYSSIAIFDNKVLLLNLYQDAFAILIENKEVADTMRLIHSLIWK